LVSNTVRPPKFIDLFAGIGGTRLALESTGAECVFTSEWDRFALETYVTNFGDDHQIVGDIREIDESDVPNHQILVGGFPCQPFSLAGVSKKNSLGKAHGFSCPIQGNLFFDVARIVAAKRPQLVILENVKNLLSHDSGRTFQIIRQTLEDDLGYSLSFKVFDAQSLVPQHRERVLMVAKKNGKAFDFDKVNIRNTNPTLSKILHPQDGREKLSKYTEGDLGKVLSKYTLSDKLWNYLQEYAEKHRKKGNGFGYGLFGPEDVARTLSARYHKDGSEILIKQSRKNPRRLTPREAARIMGFPENFEIPVSDTQAYRQFGNSVVVPLITRIASEAVKDSFGDFHTIKRPALKK
jgi:DNA (cytosine-5)-methyltransferase 1